MTRTHDFRHLRRACPVSHDDGVKHGWALGLRVGSAVASTLVVGVLMLDSDAYVAGPVPWWVAYAVFFALVLADARVPGRWGTRLWLAGQCLSAAAVYLLAPGAAFTAVCLVTSASSSAFVLPARLVALVVGVQIAVVAAGAAAVGEPAGDVVTTTVLFGGFQLFGALMAVTAIREARTRAELAEVNEELRATQSLLGSTAREGERLRISRELHDVVGHRLTALALELEVASHHADDKAAPHVEQARQAAKALLTDLRRAVTQLRVTPGEASATFGAVTGVARPKVSLDIADDVDFADADQAHTLVRCVQEVVTNAVRHADADRLSITVRRRGSELVLSARDDGVGAESVRPGNGLTGMRERLSALGGTLDWDTLPGEGFRLDATIPASVAASS